MVSSLRGQAGLGVAGLQRDSVHVACAGSLPCVPTPELSVVHDGEAAGAGFRAVALREVTQQAQSRQCKLLPAQNLLMWAPGHCWWLSSGTLSPAWVQRFAIKDVKIISPWNPINY